MTAAEVFTFSELLARTPELDGPERMAVFYELPPLLQREAFAHLGEWTAYRSQRDFEDSGACDEG